MQDEGHGHVLRLIVRMQQEVRVDVNLPRVLDVEARALLEVRQVVRVRQPQPEVLTDPEADLRRWVDEIDPDRLDLRKVGAIANRDLPQLAVPEVEGVDRRLLGPVMRGIDEVFADLIAQQQQDAVEAIPANLLPRQQPVLDRQRLKDARGIDRVETVHDHREPPEVLLVDERLDQRVARHLLPAHEALDKPSLREQLLHFLQALRQAVEFGRGRLFHVVHHPQRSSPEDSRGCGRRKTLRSHGNTWSGAARRPRAGNCRDRAPSDRSAQPTGGSLFGGSSSPAGFAVPPDSMRRLRYSS